MRKSLSISRLSVVALALLGFSACAHAIDPADEGGVPKGASGGGAPSSYGGESEAGYASDAKVADDGASRDAISDDAFSDAGSDATGDATGDAIADADIFISGDGGCGEALCTPIVTAEIGSHFTGPGCTGTESYYTPYNGYDGIRRSWDGHGLAGTTLRTETNISFKAPDGTCTDFWPSGNTLSDFVTIYR